MLIDLDALHRASAGDGNGKVAVRQEWLRAVYAELLELKRLRTQHAIGDRLAGIADKLTGLAGAHR